MKFGAKHFWTVLLLLGASSVLWIGSGLAAKAFAYVEHSEGVRATPSEWSIASKDSDHHYIALDFTFSYEGALHKGHYQYQNTFYATRELASEAITEMQKPQITAWLAPGPTGPHAILERLFPYNELVRTSLALLIFFYFLFLRSYLTQFSEAKSL